MESEKKCVLCGGGGGCAYDGGWKGVAKEMGDYNSRTRKGI